MATLRKILTKSEDESIEIETSSEDGKCDVRLDGAGVSTELDEHVFVMTVVEYGIERGILPKPRQRKDKKARRPRRDKGTSRVPQIFVDAHGSQVEESHPDARLAVP